MLLFSAEHTGPQPCLSGRSTGSFKQMLRDMLLCVAPVTQSWRRRCRRGTRSQTRPLLMPGTWELQPSLPGAEPQAVIGTLC